MNQKEINIEKMNQFIREINAGYNEVPLTLRCPASFNNR